MRLFIFFLCTLITPSLTSQGPITEQDYQRAVSFFRSNLSQKAFNLHMTANWLEDSTGVWIENNSPEQRTFEIVSFPDLDKKPLFNHVQLAQKLSNELKKEIDPKKLDLNRIETVKNDLIKFTIEGQRFIFNNKDFTLVKDEIQPEINRYESVSPDGQWKAFSKDHNLYIENIATGEQTQLSYDGQKNYEYASWYGWGDIMEGENGERPFHFGVNWSEDSKWIGANICDLKTANKMYLLDWSVDSLYRPKLLSYYRGSPGDTGMVYMHPVFFNIETGQEIRPRLPKSSHINSISVRWSATPGKVYLERSSRGYKNHYVYTFDLNQQILEEIYHESSNTNIDNFQYWLSDDEKEMFYVTEKDGWKQLYKKNIADKKEEPITNGQYYINEVYKIDHEKQTIFFTASGREKNSNPYHARFYKIQYDGTGLTLLTPENLHHNISLSIDGKYFVDNMSSVETPTKTVLRDSQTGEILMNLGSALLHELPNWTAPETFKVIARDNKTEIYGAMWKPTNFNPEYAYPIIEYSYTGPHTQVYPKEFSRAFNFQSYAELGFIIIVVDGLGSSGRSKAFHDYSYKNLGGNLEDHVLAIRQLGQKYSWLDTSRVGIFGHSAGGYDAGHAVLAYPDFYKVAVASSADHDHRMEKAWWPEMYMGWPVDSAYHIQSNITMAGNLKGKLLITHGGIDENVNPSATFKLAEALIKADKQFDMLILPSQRHGYYGKHSDYFTKVRWNYFIQHLRGVEPIWDIDF